MKCAQCLLDYINDPEDERNQFSWININEAETIIEGMAVCLPHYAERILGEPPQ